jgi:cell division protein FtsN
MARDYKNSRRKPDKKPVPGWVWMLSGLMIGLLIALLVYLSQQPGMSESKEVVQTKPLAKKTVTEKISKPEKKPVTKPETKPVKDNSLRYEFYTVLPESEIVIPEQELMQRERQSPAAQQKKHAYILQAGSFRKKQQAETLKARLALLGVESSVERVVVTGDIWYRIKIGPFVSVREINSVRNRLLHNNINAILIRAR